MIGVVAVGEVHARHIHTSSNELRQGFNGLCLGPNGADEFCVHRSTCRSKGTLLFEVDGKVVLEGRACATPAPTYKVIQLLFRHAQE